MHNRLVLALVTIALAGCYHPEIGACELACAGERCPSGLACNAQGMCASTAAEVCGDPVDAAIEDPDQVTVEVRDRRNGPLPAALVVFADASGNQVAEMQTGADGKASVIMAAGGSATVIRESTNANMGTDYAVSTFTDLWRGAHVVSQTDVDIVTRPVTISWPSPDPVMQFSYTVRVSCVTGSQNTPNLSLVIDVPERCPTFDVVVSAVSPTNPTLGTKGVFAAAQSGSSVAMDASWAAFRAIPLGYMRVPSNIQGAGLLISSWISRDIPPPGGSYVPASIAVDGSVNPPNPFVAAGAGVALVALLSVQPLVGGPTFTQMVHDRIPAGANAFQRDLDGVVMKWNGHPSFNLAMRTMAWATSSPTAVPNIASPAFVAGIVQYGHGSSTVKWRLIAPASRLVPINNTGYSIQFPEVPGMRAFEPISMDVVSSAVVNTFDVDAPVVHDVMSIFESNATDLDFFGIAGLSHMTISIGN